MNSTPSSSPDLESRAVLREQDEQRLRLTFLRMTDLGVEMVHLVAERARAGALAPVPTPTKLPELAGAYDRLMRSLRRTALLILKFTAPEPARAPAAPRPDSARKPTHGRTAYASDEEALANMSNGELDEEIERLERLEGVERPEDEEDEFAGMSHEEAVLAVLYGPEGAAWRGEAPAGGTPATAGVTPARAGAPLAGGPAGGAERGTMRPSGAKGCRDP